jgi:hypothetical protein
MKRWFLLLSTIPAIAAPAQSPIRLSAWYWLNAAPREEWERDFRHMADLGFTHTALCWGFDSAAWVLRPEDTREALRGCRRAGLGAYLVMWHPEHNSLPRKPEFQQVDVAGQLRFSFNTFHRGWRATQWKQYLQTLARLCVKEPGFAGYIFDDSFMIGSVGQFSGGGGKPEQQFVSYGPDDRRRFGKEPPQRPGAPGWDDWVAARASWWEEWARDTVRFIREIDPHPEHEIYVEDGDWALSQAARDATGIDYRRVCGPLDAVGAYSIPRWDDSPDSRRKAVENTRRVLETTRAAVGPGKRIIYTFWVANILELRKPGPATHPTWNEIREICETALGMGIRHVDMYGYRIGDYVATAEDWPARRPPAQGAYRLADPYPGKHLWDRPALHAPLREYLHALRKGRR